MNTSPKVIWTIVVAIALLAAMGVGTLCASLFLHTYADASILTAIITITSNLTGALMTLLVSPRSQPPGTSTQTTITTNAKPEPTEPTPVTVVNTEANPAKVEEVKS